MFRDFRNSLAIVGLTGTVLVAAAAMQPAIAALDPNVTDQLRANVISDPSNAAAIASAAAAQVCPPNGALEDVGELFKAIAEQAIIEQDPSDPGPAAAIADAIIAVCPVAAAVVAGELEELVQTAAGGGLAPPGPGGTVPNINSPVSILRENFVKSPNTTRLGPTEFVQTVQETQQPTEVLSDTEPVD